MHVNTPMQYFASCTSTSCAPTLGTLHKSNKFARHAGTAKLLEREATRGFPLAPYDPLVDADCDAVGFIIVPLRQSRAWHTRAAHSKKNNTAQHGETVKHTYVGTEGGDNPRKVYAL